MNDERPRRKVRVDPQELRFAMEDAIYEHQYFLNTEPGEVILVSEMFDDEEASGSWLKSMKRNQVAICKYLVPTRAKATMTCRTSSVRSATNISRSY